MNDNTFKSDLEEGKWAERLFANYAETKLGATNIIFNTSKSIKKLRE